MREILFKAKSVDNGEWVEGDLIHRRMCGNDYCFIRVSDSGFDTYDEYEVIPKTVCQYTGLLDKNDVKVFELDVIRYKSGTERIVMYVDGRFKAGASCDPIGFAVHTHEVVGNVCDEEW